MTYGDRLRVFRRSSRSVGFRRKSDTARAGVIKLRSREERLKSTRSFFYEGGGKLVSGQVIRNSRVSHLLEDHLFQFEQSGWAPGVFLWIPFL